jgi:hypothetical protein
MPWGRAGQKRTLAPSADLLTVDTPSLVQPAEGTANVNGLESRMIW